MSVADNGGTIDPSAAIIEIPDTGTRRDVLWRPSPAERPLRTFLAENKNRRTVGEASCVCEGIPYPRKAYII